MVPSGGGGGGGGGGGHGPIQPAIGPLYLMHRTQHSCIHRHRYMHYRPHTVNLVDSGYPRGTHRRGFAVQAGVGVCPLSVGTGRWFLCLNGFRAAAPLGWRGNPRAPVRGVGRGTVGGGGRGAGSAVGPDDNRIAIVSTDIAVSAVAIWQMASYIATSVLNSIRRSALVCGRPRLLHHLVADSCGAVTSVD